ncbi:MAG: leucine--tRNA ligase [Streptosporangiaceae bacterium]
MSEQQATPGRAVTSADAPFRYDAQLAGQIELRWQDRWDRAGTFHSPNPSGSLATGFERMAGRPKFYVLDMFPYASGTGIHVGHPIGYIATDAYARFLRMTGHHVLHAMGYDAFGLPAEQFALGTGKPPQITTRENIDNMRRQLRRIGMGYDTRRSIETADPAFYRWTQWIFLQIFNSWVDERTGKARPIGELIAEYSSGRRPVPDGRRWEVLTEPERRQLVDHHRLAYIANEPVNWCPGLGTVLANEEVTAEGRSDIGNHPVYRRPLRQWMLRITAMAQRLIDDLDDLAWPENIKQQQRNWIGASNGATIWLPIAGPTAGRVEVFTTRPDTLAGATYVVLAPEHPLVAPLTAASWPEGTPQAWRYLDGSSTAGHSQPAGEWRPADAVAAYQQAAARLSDRQRSASGTMSGVFTGGYVINPATGRPIPVFVADYVLMGYGTGAIMAVPAHDGRDLRFAREFGLAIRPVIEPPASWYADLGISADTPATGWPAAFEGDGSYISSSTPRLAGLGVRAGVAATIEWLERGGHGRASRRYRLRDWLFSRQRYWGEPFPIVYDETGLPVALPESALPVLLPEMDRSGPLPDQDEASEPVPPLARATGWSTVELDLGDGMRRYRRELNTMPQWAGSCWYYLRYLDPANETAFVDPQVERYWLAPAASADGDGGGSAGTDDDGDGRTDGDGGVDLYVGGAEHAVLHLLYARFWHKVLYDLGLVSTREPFARLLNQGMIQADAFLDERGMYVPAADVVAAADGSASYRGKPVTRRTGKMGKSLKNGISPDDMYRQYGADTLRLYEMAMGPLEVEKPWRPDDVIGVHRFLQRLWRCLVDEETGKLTVSGRPLDGDTSRALHGTIAVVSRDFGQLRFNTAIARLMELATIAARISATDGCIPRALAEPLVLMVAPLAPHIAEELWSRLGHAESLAYASFPQADESLVRAQTVTLPVQVNGRTRFRIEVPADAPAAEIERVLISHPQYAEHTGQRNVDRLVVVPGRIVNIIVG